MLTLPPLPYAHDALEPTMSAETLRLHHDKHHATYLEKTNELAGKAGMAGLPLEEITRQASERDIPKLFNNASQAWNHAFFWQSMSPDRSAPGEELTRDFGDAEALKAAFVHAGAEHFGSGWVWLLADASGEVEVVSTHDAASPLTETGKHPLLVCDVWEHAYYVDFRNDREAYLNRWFDNLANWRFAAAQLRSRGDAEFLFADTAGQIG